MYAIASLLDEEYTARVKDLWGELKTQCGLEGVSLMPLPHFSWQVAAGYDLARLEQVLTRLVSQVKPFTVRTSGLGLFTGENPVLYLPLVKDEIMVTLHQQLWTLAEPAANNPHPYYAPCCWVPHITLAYGDVSANKLGCAIARLGFRTFDWKLHFDHLALVYQLGNEMGQLHCLYRFSA